MAVYSDYATLFIVAAATVRQRRSKVDDTLDDVAISMEKSSLSTSIELRNVILKRPIDNEWR